jgi:hypothetical protein
VTSGPDDVFPPGEGRWARHQAESRRMVAKIFLGLAALWVVLAVLWWLNNDADAVSRWLKPR